jgi:hypothetical protein
MLSLVPSRMSDTTEIWNLCVIKVILLGPNLVSFNRAVVPYEISKVNFRVETKIISVCQKRFNELKNINISKTSQQNDFYYMFRVTHSTNEHLLNIKRKGDAKSCTLSYVRYH